MLKLLSMDGGENSSPLVWVLSDGKEGHKNQALGVAECLGFPFEIKELSFGKSSSLPNFLKCSALSGLDKKNSSELGSPWPDVVISAGRKCAPISRYIKKKAKKKVTSCQIMWPGFPACGFDLIAVPEHDGKKQSNKRLVTIGAPHRVTKAVLQREAEIWSKTLGEIKHPSVTLLVGGGIGAKSFMESHAEELGNKVSEMTKTLGSTLMVTTSRRTSADAVKVLRGKLQNQNDFPVIFHDPEKERANPYYAFLALADAIIVTGDSISMVSEALATGKPVYIYAPEDITPKKHLKFHKSLYDKGFAMPLITDDTKLLMPGAAAGLNESGKIAARLKEISGL